MITFALRFGNSYLSIDSDTAFDLNLGCRGEMFLHTAQIPFSASPRWRSTWLASPVYGISKLPSSVCLECTVFGIHRFSQHKEIISGVKIPLVDAYSRLLEGKHSYRMWGKAVADRSYKYVSCRDKGICEITLVQRPRESRRSSVNSSEWISDWRKFSH